MRLKTIASLPFLLLFALPASVVWFYQEIARRVGPQRMRTDLEKLGDRAR